MRKKQPNVLFVFPDQWRKQAVGVYHEDPVITPNIDRFAGEGLILDHAFSCYPLCSPNRSVMLTGCYPLKTGVTTNCKPGLSVKLDDSVATIGNVLKEQGYNTGYIGKWHLDMPEINTNPEPESGAKKWDAYIPPGPRRFGFDYWYAYNANDRHMSPHYWQDTPKKIQVHEWSTKHETDVAIQFIKNRNKEQPFALFLSWNPPHQPFDQLPESYREQYADKPITYRPNVKGEGKDQTDRHLRDYFAAVTATDEQFARLLGVLDEQAIAEDTIVVLTSDHGELMGAHDWMEHKNIWFEESIAVPFFIRWPGKVKQGREDLLFNSVDIVPTLLGLLDVPQPKGLQGNDYSSIFKGIIMERPTSVFICQYPGSVSDHEQAKRKNIDINAYGWRGIRTSRYTYTVQKAFGTNTAQRWLYDNEEDPYQLSPVTFAGPPQDELAQQLENELQEWLDSLNDHFDLNE